jgi:uncharacterized membrane protein YfcA
MLTADINSLALYGAAFLAGLVDAVVGGGGLIQLPALFSVFPNSASAPLLGTNKFAGLWGTTFAAANYSRKVRLRWHAVIPAVMAALPFAFLGAYVVTQIPSDFMRKLLPFVLILIAVYTFKKKDFGLTDVSLYTRRNEGLLAAIIGGCIGFYDGFFGPGTGSFLVFLFVRFLGFDFLGGSAAAKVVNVACNFAALVWFGFSGHVLWQVGAIMAIMNVAGALTGSFVAIRRGSGFVRKVFLFVVLVLIIKTGVDAAFLL